MIRVPGSAPGSAPGRSRRAPVPLQGAPDGMERRSRSGSALERTWTRPVGRAPGTRTGSLAHLDGLAGRARGCRNRPRVPGARPTGRDRVRSRLLEPGAAGERSRSAPGRSRSAPGRSRTLPSRSRPGAPLPSGNATGTRRSRTAPGALPERSRRRDRTPALGSAAPYRRDRHLELRPGDRESAPGRREPTGSRGRERGLSGRASCSECSSAGWPRRSRHKFVYTWITPAAPPAARRARRGGGSPASARSGGGRRRSQPPACGRAAG